MITALMGENSFAVREALAEVVAGFPGTPERIDGTTLSLAQLPDLLMGAQLFAADRLVIITGLSENSALWPVLGDWLDKVADTTHVVLIDEKPDKRTSSYKALKAAGVVQEFPAWTDRDRAAAEQWVRQRAQTLGLDLDAKTASYLVHRVGVEQWSLASSLDKLAVLGAATPALIDEHIDASPAANIFQLFELALQGDRGGIRRQIATLELTDDPYALFALLSSQAFQCVAVMLAGEGAEPAKEFAIHPFVVSKLSRYRRSLGPEGAKRMLRVFADADADLKTSRGEPWVLIEKALHAIAQ